MGQHHVKKINPMDIVPLKCAREVLKIKENIFRKEQHTGKNYDVCFEAWTEINEYYGYGKPKALCRSGCIKQMNIVLGNWIRNFLDSEMELPKKSTTKKKVKEDDLKAELEAMSYAELKKKAKEELSDEQKAAMGKAPKKIAIIEALLNS